MEKYLVVDVKVLFFISACKAKKEGIVSSSGVYKVVIVYRNCHLKNSCMLMQAKIRRICIGSLECKGANILTPKLQKDADFWQVGIFHHALSDFHFINLVFVTAV